MTRLWQLKKDTYIKSGTAELLYMQNNKPPRYIVLAYHKEGKKYKRTREERAKLLAFCSFETRAKKRYNSPSWVTQLVGVSPHTPNG